jgi:hypothetical protein
MPLDNQISIAFSDEEEKQLSEHFNAIKAILMSKCVSLNAEQRQEFSKLGNKTESWARKAMAYMHTQPGFNPNYIDVPETDKDMTARETLKPFAQAAETINNLVDDTMMLLGADIYNACNSYYRHIRLLAKENEPGAKAIYDDLATQFPGRASKAKE